MTDDANNPDPILLKADAAAALLGMSSKALRRADQAGKTPRPVRIGRNVRWRVDVLMAWVEADCPDRQTWEVMRRGS
jgi:predicted DNA-binding transcriptional regulator AlpA